MKPYVTLNCATSLDGVIGRGRRRIKISNHKDMVRMHRLRATVDAIVVGVGTILVDNPKLTLKYAEGTNPLRVVVDSRARTPLNAKVLSKHARTVIFVGKNAPKKRLEKLRGKSEVVVCGKKKVDLKLMLEKLAAMKIRRVMLEGGGRLNRSMIEENLVDEMNVTISPRFIGEGVHLTEGRVKGHAEFRLVKTSRLDDQIVLNYKRK